MPRDESRDVWVSVWADSLRPRLDDQCIADGPGVLDDFRDDVSEARYVPHSQLVDLERQLAEFVEDRGEQVERMLLEKHALEQKLADRDAETAKLRKRIAELEDELRIANHKEDIDRDYKDYDFPCGY